MEFIPLEGKKSGKRGKKKTKMNIKRIKNKNVSKRKKKSLTAYFTNSDQKAKKRKKIKNDNVLTTKKSKGNSEQKSKELMKEKQGEMNAKVNESMSMDSSNSEDENDLEMETIVSQESVEEKNENERRKRPSVADRRLFLMFKSKRKFSREMEDEIKSLHPDILRIIFPRQKSLWCQLQFISKEKATKACEELKRNKQFVVHPKNAQPRKKKDKFLKKKIQEMKRVENWM